MARHPARRTRSDAWATASSSSDALLDGAGAADLVLGDLAPLGSILLEQLTDRLSDTGDHRLLVVPIGRARSIPWTAVITIPWVSITAVKPVKGSCLLPE